MINVAFTGGGTGGHIYPGLAVAAQLKKLAGPDVRFFWIGSSAGMDRALVEEAGLEFFGVPSGKLRRYFSLRTFIDFFKVAAGFFASRRILKKQKAMLLFSKGGFVSVPPCAAASSLKIPVFTHESDFSPGLATKLNARSVSKTGGRIFTAYEGTTSFFSQKIRDKIVLCANPVRAAFRNADPAKGRAFLGVSNDTRILLVLGGSQGAAQVNELVRAALPELTKIFTVVHQTGTALSWDVPPSEKYKPLSYIKEEMPHVMAAAEMIMGRSGAGIWEWAVLGKPMLLIPLRGSGTRGDQIENAEFFKEAGAAFVFDADVKAVDIVEASVSLANNVEKREAMAAASAKIGERDGAEQIALVLLEKINLIMEEMK
ncbi:MAG: undecaprenyldiphospho-muramoylpentapeptide beta-N-acetylglucosaminyltransferase [Treponema sp.]|nr:undecaprenyldiphospho-muramoylpentapeptide beta-N-acetylglucosaminyltransferase [Treponema sp.]